MRLSEMFSEARPTNMAPVTIDHATQRVVDPDVKYTELGKTKKDPIMSKAIATLSGKHSEIATKLAQKFQIIAGLKKEVEYEAAQVRDMQEKSFAKYFTEEDRTMTLVIETASMTMTMSSASPASTKEVTKIDYEGMLGELLIMMPHLEQQLIDLKEKFTDITVIDVPAGTNKILQPKFKGESIEESNDPELDKISHRNDIMASYLQKLKQKYSIGESAVTEQDGDEYAEEDIFNYLLKLRDSGVVNMFGASPYLQRDFGMGRNESREWLSRWMKSFK